MARISGVNIPSNKRVVVALTYIYGIGTKISENICIIISLGHLFLKKSSRWENINAYIQKIAQSKSSLRPGLTNKTIFKFMDICETI